MIFNAFFKGWLLPSLPLDSLHWFTSLNTYTLLWGLSWRSGLFPSRLWTLSPKVCLFLISFKRSIDFGVCRVSVRYYPPSKRQYSTSTPHQKRSTYIDFAENQLSPSLISLSLLTATHPSTLQRTQVRSSDLAIFNLVTVRSLGFGSKAFNWSFFFKRFAFTGPPPNGLSFAKNFNLLVHYTKGKLSKLFSWINCFLHF